MVYDAEGESAMATSQDQREGELQVSHCILYNTLLNSDRLIGCLWSRDIE